ncbi:MAG: glycyl-radical enzyme activating protein [Planctomycetes bacterium]|nr:glycyl-radical enzyme activating protein [Planctomycetota bacterium]MCD7896849.1 glycyl-radical enzyme activating protein [Planctomycetaceae bacterium]
MSTTAQKNPVTGIVFDTQRFATHDGHGIRTLIFLKGCPLRCEWCTNPESQAFEPEPGLFADKCAGCMKCADVCPYGEAFREAGRVEWDKCEKCLRCVDACLYEARVPYGRSMSVDDVLRLIRRDKVFFKKSGGGVTLGGGEATCQPDFAAAILRACREEGIHTAMETCGCTPWPTFSRVIAHVDLLLMDLKHMDSTRHREKTAVGNEIILDNAVRAAAAVPEMIVRFPLIPDFNDSPENVEAMGAFIREKMPRVRRVDILQYHSVGESKNARIGKEYAFTYTNELTPEKVDELKRILESHDLTVSIGG